MTSLHFKITTLLLWVVILNACHNQKTIADIALEEIAISSKSLANNFLNDTTDIKTHIYLPPDYHQNSHRRYPVLYLLHGFDGSHFSWANNRIRIDQIMRRHIAKDPENAMIIVMPNAHNRYWGSFYSNSSVTGHWEDFLTKELINYVDHHYRTLPQSQSRAIAGHSMGGYGALKMAIKHAHIFSTVYGMSSCCLGMMKDLSATNPVWIDTFQLNNYAELWGANFYSRVQIALAAAWSPNEKQPPFYVNFPFKEINSQIVPAEPAYSQWLKQMPLYMLADYMENIRKLRGIGFEVGAKDGFSHILATNKQLAKQLGDADINHQFKIFDGNHFNRLASRIENHMLPFVSTHLINK